LSKTIVLTATLEPAAHTAVKPAPPPAGAGMSTTDAPIVADFVNVPKRPNTKPAMAMAAINVIAMRMTVASTGEIALRLTRWDLICNVLTYWKVPLMGTLAPLLVTAVPVKDEPVVPVTV